MLCDCSRPGIEGSEIQVILWVLKVTAVGPYKSIVSVASGLKEHRERSDQDVEVCKEKERRCMTEIL